MSGIHIEKPSEITPLMEHVIAHAETIKDRAKSKQMRPFDAETGEYRVRDPKLQPGDRVEILLYDGSKHPELAGRTGFVSLVKQHSTHNKLPTILIEVDHGGGTYKSDELWWRRSPHF